MRARRLRAIVLVGVAVVGLVSGSYALGQDTSQTGPLRLGIVTDVHANVADSPGEHKVMTSYPARLGAFVEAMIAWPADLVIDLGDFVNGAFVIGAGPVDPAKIPGVLADAEVIYARFPGPHYHVLGNHDVYDLSKDEFLAGTQAIWTYGSFEAKGYHVVILDAQFSKKDEPLGHATWVVQGKIPPVELDWLRADLAATKKPTLVCVHQRLDKAFDVLSGGPEIANATDVRKVLADSHVVVAVFQGHDHVSAYSLVDGIHYLTFAALVDEGTPPSWAEVALDPIRRTIDIMGTGDEPNRHLTY